MLRPVPITVFIGTSARSITAANRHRAYLLDRLPAQPGVLRQYHGKATVPAVSWDGNMCDLGGRTIC